MRFVFPAVFGVNKNKGLAGIILRRVDTFGAKSGLNPDLTEILAQNYSMKSMMVLHRLSAISPTTHNRRLVGIDV